MKITEADVKHVADLARLKLSSEEMQRLTQQMEGIIAFADKLSELDTEGVEPTAHAIPMQNVFREDVCLPSYDREKLLANAPAQDSGCVMVPQVVE